MILSGRYRVDRELGSGGMATVYLAQDLKHQRTVAVKILRPELAASLGTDRFLREIEIAAGLDHPHILPLYDSGENDGQLYYVMPYVEGESLRDRLHREGMLPIDQAIRIARQVADALSAAHARGIIHRDIKPENILLSGGHARVADFGIARAVSEAGGARLTSAGVAIGTPAYMSPEQATGDAGLDARSDIYALGCVLFEMLAGEAPYSGPTAQSILVKRLTEPVPRISTLRETVSPALEQVVHRALAKAPADRPATASALMHELDAAAVDGAAPKPARRQGLLVLAGIAAAALAALAVMFALSRREARELRTPVGAESLARGDRLLKQRTPEAFASAMGEYEQAYSRDSGNPEALARIGYAYALFADWGWTWRGLSQSTMRAKALDFSERALAADSTSAAAWLSRAFALVQVDPYRMRGAVDAFERSVRIDSTSAEAWYQYGQTLMYLGQDSAAIRAYRRSFLLDRERPMSLMSLSAILWKTGRRAEAQQVIDSAVLASRTVSAPYVHVVRGNMALEAGDAALAGDEADLALALDTTYSPPARALLVRVYAARGDTGRATAEMKGLLASIDTGAPSPTSTFFVSAALVALGRVDEALGLLERSKPRGAQLWFYMRNPVFDRVRTQPRFVKVFAEADPRGGSGKDTP